MTAITFNDLDRTTRSGNRYCVRRDPSGTYSEVGYVSYDHVSGEDYVGVMEVDAPHTEGEIQWEVDRMVSWLRLPAEGRPQICDYQGEPRPFPADALQIGEWERDVWAQAVDIARAVISEMRSRRASVDPADVDIDSALRPRGDDFVLRGLQFSSQQLEQVWAEAVR